MDKNMILSPWPKRTVRHMSSFNNTPSAVLVPIVEVGGELRFLYEVRSMALHWQPGDISFPGGKIEPSDSYAEAAAIRETMEELSVRREDIHILSPLDYVESVTGVDIYPFAAHLDAYENIRCTAEVDHLFTVPIRWFMNHQPEKADMDLATRPGTHFPVDIYYPGNPMDWRRRKSYFVYVYRYNGYRIWGMTAQITKHCVELIQKM